MVDHFGSHVIIFPTVSQVPGKSLGVSGLLILFTSLGFFSSRSAMDTSVVRNVKHQNCTIQKIVLYFFSSTQNKKLFS